MLWRVRQISRHFSVKVAPPVHHRRGRGGGSGAASNHHLGRMVVGPKGDAVVRGNAAEVGRSIEG